MKRAVAYLRVSSIGQEDGNGFVSQNQAIERWCEREGYELVLCVRDTVSGAAPMDTRDVFCSLVREMRERHEADVLVVANRSRLARDHLVAGMLDKYAVKHGVSVASADGLGIVDETTPEGMLIKGLMDLLAQWDRMNINLRLRTGLDNARRYKGIALGCPPYGYMKTETRGIWKINPVEAEVIRLIFELADNEGKTSSKIAPILNEAGYRTHDGLLWTVPKVQHIYLNRPIYDGRVTHRRNLRKKTKEPELAPGVTNKHPPIIPRITPEAEAKIIAKRGRRGRPRKAMVAA